jgi:hypothetical protein
VSPIGAGEHPKEWIIVGLFYPPQAPMRDLFE